MYRAVVCTSRGSIRSCTTSRAGPLNVWIRPTACRQQGDGEDIATAMTINHLAVFCGARSGAQPEYAEAARGLGKVLAEQGIGLVYGGGTVGLMGEIANTVLKLSGPQAIYGVIPKSLTPRELAGDMIGEVVLVDDMHTRKALMARRADGFIGLPGGFGTLEELLEVITWQQLGFHVKPIGLLNVQGFYDPLLTFFDHCVQQGFISVEHRNNLIVSADPAELVKLMKEFKPSVALTERMIRQMRDTSKASVGLDVSKASEQQD